MVKIIDKRDTGKTRKLLEECSKNDGIFICKHPERVSDKCRAYGLPFVDAYHYLELSLIDTDRPIYIDELEEYIKTINKTRLGGWTLTDEE